jgi:peptidyl-prolyl cis-trans isomerase C
MFSSLHRQSILFCGLIMLIFLAACSSTPTPALPTTQSVPSATPTPFIPEPTATFTPSPTPIPLAALVNGEGITLEEYQAELTRYNAALNSGTDFATDLLEDSETFVMNDLINQVLLAQSAYSGSFSLDDATLQNRIEQLTAQAGGDQAMEAWLTANGYTDESFHQALKRSLAGAWMRDQIISAVPATAEQVHARQILLYNLDQANEVFAQLQSGGDFEALADTYDPVTGGELGWFPRGYLTMKALEDAAFSLEPGQYSPVIQTSLGYHIVKVLERDPSRSLEPNARQVLQGQTLAEWLQQRRAQSEIQILLP